MRLPMAWQRPAATENRMLICRVWNTALLPQESELLRPFQLVAGPRADGADADSAMDRIVLPSYTLAPHPEPLRSAAPQRTRNVRAQSLQWFSVRGTWI